MIKIKKGLDLPIAGEPLQQISEGANVSQVAVLGPDYNGMKPSMLVQVGDEVKKGQPLFTDKKTPGVLFTAPGAGKISAVNRGHKRALQSVVIDLAASEEEITFKAYDAKGIDGLKAEEIREQLIQSGQWTCLRTRPYSKSPAIDATPAAIFVNAMDSNPLAALPGHYLNEQDASFQTGLQILKKLTEGNTYLCYGTGGWTPDPKIKGITVQKFSGKHPAGLSGTHIHFLDPVNHDKSVWSVNYQDVIAIGKLFETGKIFTDRVISIAGPQVENPRLIRTRIGAKISELTKGELKEGENRAVSGSVFWGHTAADALDYLGRYSLQISVLLEGRQRDLMSFQMPGFTKFSIKKAYASAPYANLIKKNFTTNCEGSKRAIVATGMYEQVMPLDIEPSYLLRSLVMNDTDMSQKLGCLELDEEDLALCTFVDTGKHDFGPILRENLTIIEKEG